MNHILVANEWEKQLMQASVEATEAMLIVCPFIKVSVAKKLLDATSARNIRLLTRNNLEDFYIGVSDIDALKYFLKRGAEIRVIKHLHSKLYLFDETRAIITSANLTESALSRNLELGISTSEPSTVLACCEYFRELWEAAEENLTWAGLESSDARVEAERVLMRDVPKRPKLPDEGIEIHSKIDHEKRLVSGSKRADKIEAFLKRLVDVANADRDLIKPIVIGSKLRNAIMQTGIRGVKYCFVANGQTSSAIELIINKGSKGLQAFNRLKSHKDAIERELGFKLLCDPIGEKKETGQIRKLYPRGFDSSSEEIRELHVKMVEDMVTLQRVLAKYIAAMDFK